MSRFRNNSITIIRDIVGLQCIDAKSHGQNKRLQPTLKSQSSVVHVNKLSLTGVINFTVDIHSFTSEVAVDH